MSSLHVIEHIGPGRYGDPVEPYGCRHTASELVRVLKGSLLIGTPIGRAPVCFDAHRVWGYNKYRRREWVAAQAGAIPVASSIATIGYHVTAVKRARQ